MTSKNKHFFIRLCILFMFILIYHSFDWISLRKALYNTLILINNSFNIFTISDKYYDELGFVIDGVLFYVSPNCTYIDLVLLIAPFWWRFRQTLRINFFRLLVLFVVIMSGNLVRITTALYFYDRGASWTLAHNVPDIILHVITISFSVIMALKNDFQIH